MSKSKGWEYVPPEQRRLIGDDAIAQYINDHRRAFVEYVIEQAETPVYAEAFDRDALADALHTLSNDGFRTPDANGPTVVCVAHPKRYNEFIWTLDREPGQVGGSDGVTAYGAEIKADGAVPVDRIVCVHPAAIAPNIPHLSSFNPWIVQYPKGVAIIEIHDY